MTTSTPTNEGVAIAATVIAQAKGDVPSARRVLGDAHRWTCTIDPSFKLDDKDKRIADLEAQVQASGEDREWDAMRADRDDFQAKVAALTNENANLTRIASELTGRVFAIQGDRDQANESNDALRDELAAVKLELANVRALNFDAPRKADPERDAQIVEPVVPGCLLCGNATQGDRFHCATCIAKLAATQSAPVAVEPAAPVPVQVTKPTPASSDPVRPSNVSEGAWASMSPMMRSFAAKRAAAVN